MKHLFRTFCVLLAGVTTFASCLKSNDEEVETTGDMSILKFSLTAVNRYTQTISSRTGNDTIIKTSLTTSNYPMTIDPYGCRIYNQKPLPKGSDLRHVLCSVTAKSSAGIVIKSMTSDSLFWFSTKDSIDFSQPRIFRVYATNGDGYRDYTVTLESSETEGVDFEWRLNGHTNEADGWTEKVLLPWGDSVMLADRGTVVKDGMAWRVNAMGLPECSLDGTNWQPQDNVTTTMTNMLAAGTKELFARATDGRIMRSTDDGLTWATDTTDTDTAWLPTENTASVTWPYTPADDTDYILLVGNGPQQGMTLWRKISYYTDATHPGQWVYMPVDGDNIYPMPQLSNLSLARYEGILLAMGNTEVIYQSRDQGITWRTSTDYALPSNVGGTAAAMTTDSKGRLWLVTNTGEVWLGTKW